MFWRDSGDAPDENNASTGAALTEHLPCVLIACWTSMRHILDCQERLNTRHITCFRIDIPPGPALRVPPYEIAEKHVLSARIQA